MALTVRRAGIFAAVFAIAALACGALAPAAVEMSTGIRYVMNTGTLDDCSAKAKTALAAYLENPTESPAGSGDWLATGPLGINGPPTDGAAVRCTAIPKGGYVVTFTCVVQTPENPYAADALCLDIAHNFSGKAVTPLPTATPLPTGCTPTSLVGTWTSDDKPGLSFTFAPDGSLTDSEGVSGNWLLYNGQVTFTYYGTHMLSLSSDGKHMSGAGYHLTRKC
ncbi:MAG TPA: hypothetical protein VMF61_03270 [Candidatus Acidoferrales bacterium]|nr:hypothetical protein [Candidatus Acidoferrales bacterium]